MLSACASLCVFSLHVSLARVCACALMCEKATAAAQLCLRGGRDTFHVIWQHRRAANIQTAFPQHSINAWTRSYVFQGRLLFLEVREVGVEAVDKPFFFSFISQAPDAWCLTGFCLSLLKVHALFYQEPQTFVQKKSCKFWARDGGLFCCFVAVHLWLIMAVSLCVSALSRPLSC